MKDRFQMGRSQVGWMLFLGIVVAAGLALFVSLGLLGGHDQQAVAQGPSVKIEQCQNGGVGATPERCVNLGPGNNNWVTGNVNGQKAHWAEGDSLPYRAILNGLNPGVNTVTFSFDTTKSSELEHAIDYLASYDYTETTGPATTEHANQIDPCGDVFSCDPSSPTAVAAITVPPANTTSYPLQCADGTFTGSALAGQEIKAWSEAAGGVSAMSLSYPDAPNEVRVGETDCPTQFKITFTVAPDTSTVVVTWGGHVAANGPIAVGGYWGTGNAVPTGSPYHMHAGFQQESPLGTFFNVGNQDLALASSAIVQPETPTVTTSLSATNITLGASVTDSVTVTGTVAGGSPTGSVTVTMYSNDTCTTAVGSGVTAVLVPGAGNASTATGVGPFTPPSTGTFYFKAHYNTGTADPQYTNADSVCTEEQVVVGKKQLDISTTVHTDSPDAALVGNLPLGGSVHDWAQVSGKADALALPDVTFYFFGKGVSCTNGSTTGGTALNTMAPDATTGIAHPSTSETNLAAGTYNFMAVVASNDNYLGKTSNCEPFTVDKGNLTLTTEVHKGSSVGESAPLVVPPTNLYAGDKVHDSAQVSGIVPGIPPANTVTFKWYSDLAGTAGEDCWLGTLHDGGSHAIDSTGLAHPSSDTTALGTGSYAFRASLVGDSNYTVNGGASGNSACEPFDVARVDSLIGTDLHNSDHSLMLGGEAKTSTVHDQATVTGWNPTGTVTFTFYTGGDCTTGTAVVDDPPDTVTLVGGIAHPSKDRGPLSAGSYAFMAHYNGDSNNTEADSPCEPFTVSRVKVIKTESTGAPTLQYEFRLTGGPDDVNITKKTCLDDDPLCSGNLDFGVLPAASAGDPYELCELGIAAGTNSTLEDVVVGGDILAKTIDNTLGNVCVTFTLAAGYEKDFNIDNWRPGGGQRTIGYWKNWNSCSHDEAFVARSIKTGNHLADEFFPITIGVLTITHDQIGCQNAVAILNKSDVATGAKRASDAAYGLAAQLLGAKLNVAAGAGTCTAATNAIAQGQALLASAPFTGTGEYWKGGKNAAANRATALSLAGILDQYNNGTLCH